MVIAIVVENGIRVAIPLSLYGALELGEEAGEQVLNLVDGYEEAELAPDEVDELRQYVEPDAL